MRTMVANAVANHASIDGAYEELIGSVASGTATRAEDALVGSLVCLNKGAHDVYSAVEHICADALLSDTPVALSDGGDCRCAVMSRIENSDENAGETPHDEPADAEAALLPAPLRRYLGVGSGPLPWKKRFGGFAEIRLRDEAQDVRLLKIEAGRAMPDHGHGGLERTLVLSGSFSDETGKYARGDMQIADDSLSHQPVAGADEDCICFIVVDEPLKFRNPLARMVAPFLDR